MRGLKAKIQEIWTNYIAEFPPEKVSREMPSATLDIEAANSTQATEIRTSNMIQNERVYHMSLAAWGRACEKAVEDS
eukprot:9173568-Lingulodinium_polyedra.AAC.1